MPNWWVKCLGGDDKVDDYVGITPLWDGTNLAGSPDRLDRPGAGFLVGRLFGAGAVLRLLPPVPRRLSGLMDGATNVVVQDVCGLDQSEHLSIAFDPITAYKILNALDPTDPPRRCRACPSYPGSGRSGIRRYGRPSRP